MENIRKFKCDKTKNPIGLLFGFEADLYYSINFKKYFIRINDMEMGYNNIQSALRDLKSANFEEINVR